MYERRGALWIDFTKRYLIKSDHYLTTVINYIHQNPVKHGFVNNFEDWDYSSYHSILSAKPTSLNRSTVLDWFGSREEFISFHVTNNAGLLEEWEY